MQNRKKVLILASLLFAACGSDPIQDAATSVTDPQEPAAAKICNSSTSAVKGTIIAKFNEEAIPVLEEAAARQAATRSQVTRSGIQQVDEIFEELHVSSFKRVFPYAGDREAQTRAAGLHRWYVLTFDEDQDLDAAAERLASVAEVSKVQFSVELRKAYDGKAYPFTGGAHGETRALVTSDFNDPNLFWQWHYINNADAAISTTARVGADVNAAPAWKLTGGNSQVIVAIVDEGIKYTHPDLAANMWTNPKPSPEYNNEDIHGYNFVDDGPITWDKRETSISGEELGDSGHGTHVAGTVAAVNNNGIGVAGVAGGTGNNDGVRLMSCQIFSGSKGGTDLIASQAIKYAADHGASILQCSYGYSGNDISSDRMYEERSPLEHEALLYFMNQKNCPALDGGLVFYAAGNDGLPVSQYPGAYRDVISVTSIAPDYLPAYYTCYGPGCNVAAPGGETAGQSGGEKAGVLSTLCSEISGADYGYMQGTSMACPHASGVAALGLSYALAKGKHYTREEFVSMFLTSVSDLECYLEGTKETGAVLNLEDYRGKMGTGLIDAYQLLMQIEGTPCLKVPTGSLQLITLSQYFGGSANNLTYTGIEMSKEDQEKLGLPSEPEMYNGQLMIKCMKPGVAHITVKAVAGGNRPGSATIIGGIEVTKEFAIIARDSGSKNGGWL